MGLPHHLQVTACVCIRFPQGLQQSSTQRGAPDLWYNEKVACYSSPLHPGTATRNPVLQPRVWIVDLVFGNFGAPFCFVFTSGKLSGPRNLIPEGLTELSASRESSRARLGSIFGSFSPEV